MIGKWLNAKHYISKYKPVPIDEFLVIGSNIYPASISTKVLDFAAEKKSIDTTSMPPLRMVRSSTFKELSDQVVNAVVALAIETASAGYGALVFCRSRQRSQTTALSASRAMPGELVSEETMDKRREIITELRNLPTGLDDTLAKTILKGVAFHRMMVLGTGSSLSSH